MPGTSAWALCHTFHQNPDRVTFCREETSIWSAGLCWNSKFGECMYQWPSCSCPALSSPWPNPHTHLLIHTHFWPGSEVLGTSVYRSEAGGQRHGQLLYRPTWASRPVKKDSQLIHWKADLALFSRNHIEIARNLEPTLTGRFWALMVSEFQHFKSEDLGLG